MPEIARYDNAWAGLISRVRFGKGLVDMVNGQKLSFVRPGAGLKRFERELVALGANVPIVEKNGQVLLLEGPATNKCTCAKSNPQDLTNISKAGDAAAVLSVVNDATALAEAGLSAFGPNVYKLDNGAGTTAALAGSGGTAGNTNAHSLSAYVRGTGQAQVRLSSGAGAYQTLGTGYVRIKTENVIPVDSSRGLMIEVPAGSIVYFTLPQLEEGPVYTSPIPGGTGAITRASAGSDTSGNGLSLALSQQMVDSLKGEMIDWSTAWDYSPDSSSFSISGKTITCASGTENIRHARKSGALALGQVYEVSYTVTGLSGGSMRLFFGASGNAATAGLPVISTDGTYIGREVTTTGTAFGVRFNVGATGSVTINYCRRVLENGQTNRGDGTICQWVDIPWDSSAVTANQFVSVVGANNTLPGVIYGQMPGTTWRFPNVYDGVSNAFVNSTGLNSGRYCLISQFSAALGKMRVGLWNPATGALTWSRATLAGGAPYRGVLPIYGTGNQQRLRWGYGLGNLPIGLIEMRWFNRILSNSEVLYHAQEGLL